MFTHEKMQQIFIVTFLFRVTVFSISLLKLIVNLGVHVVLLDVKTEWKSQQLNSNWSYHPLCCCNLERKDYKYCGALFLLASCQQKIYLQVRFHLARIMHFVYIGRYAFKLDCLYMLVYLHHALEVLGLMNKLQNGCLLLQNSTSLAHMLKLSLRMVSSTE